MNSYFNGYDISSIQNTNFSWQQVVNAGVSFIIHRCGIGNSGIDKDCYTNIAAAKAAGLKTGVYHFIYPLPPLASQPLRDPVAQANYHFNAAQGEPAFIDCEWPTPQTFSQWGCSASQIEQWMVAYFAEYERLDGRKPYLYTYPSWGQVVNLNTTFTQYPLWIASYTTTPVIPKPWIVWTLWQTAGGSLAKLSNGVPVDTNVCKDLSIFDATPIIVQPPPVPVVSNVSTQSVPIASPVQPIPAQPDPAATHPSLPQRGRVEIIASDVESVINANPGILTTIGNLLAKLLKLLLSIK